MKAVKCGLLFTCLNIYVDTLVSMGFFRINSVLENRYFNNSKGLFDWWLLTSDLSSLIMFSILQQHAILHHSNSDR